ncbi:MAG: sulfite exporter TauE/SafE family protein [Nitrosopumilus sp.]|jgi:cytochrome c-type biogenesis protein|nr:sulfite exporter TauE/SafE family protein [Nitrosopumilus sp.]MDH3502775.1 sulfite exporter TauE/SafE family protein [Nitrosopumilus sp.]
MSAQLGAKRSLIFSAFIMFSLIFLGGVFVATNEIAISAGHQLSYPSWLIISYLSGLSMIILPCTLPLVFIIIPLSMGKGGKKGLVMALLFGSGLIITISLYGVGIGAVGQTATLDQISVYMFLIAGIAAFLFGLSQLKLLELKLPTYSGTPKFIQNRGDYSKSFFMGLLLGNAGVGCPNPMFYWLLIYVASTGSMEIGASLGAVHGIGRAIPLILLSILAVIGINYTKRITANRENIEKLTGWLLIILGAFLIIQGIPGGHEWYENTIIHIAWNNLISMTSLPPEFHISQHIHDYDISMPQEFAPVLFVVLIIFPIVWYFTHRKKVMT